MKKPITVALCALPLAMALGDDYQFIRTPGWNPVSASLQNSFADRSGGVALSTAGKTAKSPSCGLEARFRSWDESDGVELRSDINFPTVLFVR